MNLLASLQNLGLSAPASKVYVEMLRNGKLSARQLADHLSMSRPSVYDQLKTLLNLGLINEVKEDEKTFFAAADSRNLDQLAEDKIKELTSSKEVFAETIPRLTGGKVTSEPRIKFYSGVEGVKNVLRDMLWRKNMETLTMWPISDMVALLGEEYLEDLNKRRIRNNISIRGIWPKDKVISFKKYPFLGVGGRHLREMRLAPPGMTWDMSYWLYDDRAAFISSDKERFGFVVQSADFASLIKANFEVAWKTGTPVKSAPVYTDVFLRRL